MERIQKSQSSDNSKGWFHVTLLASRDIILLGNTLWRYGLSATMHHQKRKTLDEASLLLSESETQHDHRSTSTPYGSHRLVYRALYLNMCARRRCHVCIEKIILTMNVLDR